MMQKVFLGGTSTCVDLFQWIGRSQQGFLQEGSLDSCGKLTCLTVPQVFLVLFQMLVSVGLYQRFVEDKIHQFVDLCSLSNVSVFILTHRCYGFYIHGRSIHGHADVSLDTMLSYLKKEEDNLCPLRGLEPNSETQTFEVLLTDQTRRFYDRILLSLMEHQRGLHSRPDLHQQRMKGYHALNWFLVSFLEHRYNDMDYIVKDKFFSERIMDLEFQEQGDLSVLYNGTHHALSYGDLSFKGWSHDSGCRWRGGW
ncbi:PREDICTED: meckelin-like, partial [Thamnophis sirtalis]|uniref:Meckelin-like n=1 Tax=Thamnophis sirtalis TaxID=35019 RepID=A0A6I9XHL6_9SAUR